MTEKGLCHGCGTCAGVCSNNAIVMEIVKGLWSPRIIPRKCTDCGVCVKVCPGYAVNFDDLNKIAFKNQHSNDLSAKDLNCYVSYSLDNNLRYNSASGGLVSQVLIYALEQGIIDGALVTRMSSANPLESEAFIARSTHDIIAASKSKYCPVAANYALKDILHEKGKFAVVGLPCHIHGIRKVEKLFPEFHKKIVLHLGLMCSHMVSFTGTEFVIGKLNIKKDQVQDIAYRGNGWPGFMTINTIGGSKSIPLVGNWHSYWPVFSSFLYTPLRCTMCPDQLAELADISLGDAWLSEFRDDKMGKSILVARTKFANNLLYKLKTDGKIYLLPSSLEKVERSQSVNLRFKKDDFSTRIAIIKMFNKQTPIFVPDNTRYFSIMASIRSLFIFFSIKLSLNKKIMAIISRFPFPLFRVYSGIYRTLSIER